NTEKNPKKEYKTININTITEPVRKKENVNPSKKNLLKRPVINKKFPSEKPKNSETHLKTIEIPLNLLIPFINSDKYSSSEKNENIT
ncbi:hypothetical protein DF186_18830, partial [Enterococcus hirae]